LLLKRGEFGSKQTNVGATTPPIPRVSGSENRTKTGTKKLLQNVERYAKIKTSNEGETLKAVSTSVKGGGFYGI